MMVADLDIGSKLNYPAPQQQNKPQFTFNNGNSSKIIEPVNETKMSDNEAF